MKLGTLELHKKERIELGNGEETKNDNERERERAYRFVEVEAWGEERKNMKKKNWVFGFVYRFPKKGVYLHFFKKKLGTLKNFSLCQISKNWKKNWIIKNW